MPKGIIGNPRLTQDTDGVWWLAKGSQNTRNRCPVFICETCNEKFPTRPGTVEAKYCSDGCSRHYCDVCGTQFIPGSGAHKFCSNDCKLESKRTNCIECGKSYLPGKGSEGKFCTTECFYENTVPTFSTKLDKSTGYVIIKVPKGTPGTKNGTLSRWMYEHRYVMQQHVGRPLESHEEVHHRNGQRADNRLENLEIWDKPHPKGQRVSDLIVYAEKILELYGSDTDKWK